MKTGRRVKRPSHAARTTVFLVIAAVTLAAAGYLLFLRPGVDASDAAPGSIPVTITMAGFSPDRIEGTAGEPIAITLVNPDNSHHSDGGGWHDLVIEALDVNVRVPPESTLAFTIPPAPAGEYRWYCDICCGGNANPSMWGTLVVNPA